MAMLEVDEIHTYYGNIQALKGVSLTVEEGECVTLIGSNGAGKSTTLRSISALTPARTGEIRFRGKDVARMAPQDIVQLGISQSPEGRKVFPRMTVRENLDMGAYLRRDKEIDQDLDRVFSLFPRLKEREKQKAGTMSGEIRFRGKDVARMAPQDIVQLGISQSPEGRKVFPRMTVRENLDMGAYLRRDKEIDQDLDRVFSLFPRLKEREKQKAGTMSG